VVSGQWSVKNAGVPPALSALARTISTEERQYRCDLVGHSIARALNGTSRIFLGVQTISLYRCAMRIARFAAMPPDVR
jgi:hypothetical protein